MATSLNISEKQKITSLDALWALIMGQKKSVRRALAERLNAYIEAENEPKVKMTEEEFYAKLDKSIESAKNEPVYTMGDNETGEEFINRLLAQSN